MANNTLLFCLGAFFCCIVVCEAQYEDVRCKCVCPKLHNQTNIFVKSFPEPGYCKCENVIDNALQKGHYCDRCVCKWQRRNTTTIQVVVILIICIVALLFLYMLFLLCLDPLMSRRPKYLEHQNEEDTQQLHRMDDTTRPQRGVVSRVRKEVSKVRGEQQTWKGKVQEQRRNIYDRHAMLN